MQATVNLGRVGHAYIFLGPAGSGKRLLAMSFAKAILCGQKNPCGACTSCKTLESGNHADVIFVRPSKKSLGIDDVREQIVDIVHIMPFSSARRIFVIEAAETMTIPGQNALLKTLEDGPRHAIFFLLSKNAAFLPTVLSRCICYKIPPVAPNLIYQHLLAQGLSPARARLGTDHSAGSIGRAMAISSDDDFLQLQKTMLQIVDGLDKSNIPAVFASAKTIETHKDRIHEAMDIAMMHFRDQMLAGCNTATQKIRIIEDTRQKLKQNCNFLLAIEVMLLRMSSV